MEVVVARLAPTERRHFPQRPQRLERRAIFRHHLGEIELRDCGECAGIGGAGRDGAQQLCHEGADLRRVLGDRCRGWTGETGIDHPGNMPRDLLRIAAVGVEQGDDGQFLARIADDRRAEALPRPSVPPCHMPAFLFQNQPKP